MITSTAGAANYLRPAQTIASTAALTRADALPKPSADQGADVAEKKHGVVVSDVKKLDTLGLTVVSLKDNAELRDRLAAAWLQMNATLIGSEVPDNAPQNTYAAVKVNGQVVATLYNGGSVAMTNQAAAAVGDLQDPPGLIGGPVLAQWRAERIAKAVGGTIEKASTAITPSEWRPRQSTSPDYSREQLDAAFEAMTADAHRATTQRSAGYSAAPDAAGARTDLSA